MTTQQQAAIEQARSHNGKPVIIELQNADYNIYREYRLYYRQIILKYPTDTLLRVDSLDLARGYLL